MHKQNPHNILFISNLKQYQIEPFSRLRAKLCERKRLIVYLIQTSLLTLRVILQSIPQMLKTQKNLRKPFFHFLLLSVIFFTGKLNAQNPEEFNKIYTKTYLDTSQKDFNKALKIADSLFTISETPRFKAKSLMLSASLLQQSGEIKRAVNYALQAEQILKDGDDYAWKAKISGFLATQYRHLKLSDQSKKYIDETIESAAKIEDQKIVNQTMGFVMQEKAYYENEMRNYNKSISFIGESQKFFDLSGQNNPFLTANNEQLFGLNYYSLKDYDKALTYYHSALKKLDQMPDNFLKGLVLNGLAKIYIAKEDKKKAKEYLKKAENIAEGSEFLSVKNEIYKTSQDYYALTKNIDQFKHAKLKQDSIVEKIEDKSSKFVNESYSILKKKNDDINKETQTKSLMIIIFSVLIISGLIYFIIYRRRQKKNFNKIKQILADLELGKKNKSLIVQIENNNLIADKIEDNNYNAQVDIQNQPLMTSATENKILSKLEKFEETTIFTRNSMSLPYLASYCNTNTKYLSYIVNTHKKKDFKNYINELRVIYIIDKLKSDPQYQKYKISTLAEEAGFSSQSKFAAAFRKVTTVSPSQFLEHIKLQKLN